MRLATCAGALAVACIAAMDDAAAIREFALTGKRRVAIAVGPWDR
jgi:hypothetical protein